MKKKKIALFFFIDAFGWKVLEKHPFFLKEVMPYQKRLRTILGYSNACDPSIISGRKPAQHGHWSSFYYSPHTSEYAWTYWLKYLPKFLADRSRFRDKLSKIIKSVHGYTGYFQIYQVPFEHLPLFDYSEKRRIWTKGGLLKGKSIFDNLYEMEIPYYVGDEDSEINQVAKVQSLIQNQAIEFAYLLFGRLDAVMHAYGTHHTKVLETIRWLERTILAIIRQAERKYKEVECYVFSDHGMHNVMETYDLQSLVQNSGLSFGSDYVAFYDSTMARFWYLNSQTEAVINNSLQACPKGRILSDEELQNQGVYFSDHQYGETVFLMNPGVLIIPSFMGLKKIDGMHGYDPDDADSYAMIAGNHATSADLVSIEQIYHLLKKSIT